jgi:hypothetical protein
VNGRTAPLGYPICHMRWKKPPRCSAGSATRRTRQAGANLFLLVVAAEKPEALEGLEDLTASMLTNLPPLPPKTVIWLKSDEENPQSKPLRSAEEDPAATVAYKLDQLRQRLNIRKLPLSVFRGVAYRR